MNSRAISSTNSDLYIATTDGDGERRFAKQDGREPDRKKGPSGCRAQVQVCQQLTEQLGLVYGAIDLIRTVDDDLVFLEINPVGSFLAYTATLDLPVGESIAQLLER